MALKKTIEELKDLLQSLQIDLEKAEKGNKAASQRVRTGTVRLEKVAKNYRKESIAQEKTAAPKKAPAKKTKAAARPFAIRK
ncbi:MAG: histone, partial [Chlamydiia bacterium]|nr:histone [Chlamydiia bacterium]